MAPLRWMVDGALRAQNPKCQGCRGPWAYVAAAPIAPGRHCRPLRTSGMKTWSSPASRHWWGRMGKAGAGAAASRHHKSRTGFRQCDFVHHLRPSGLA